MFHNAKHSNLQIINTIHNAGLRISIGAFKSNPINSIHNIAGISSLKIRSLQNVIITASKKASNELKIMENFKDILKKVNFSHAEK